MLTIINWLFRDTLFSKLPGNFNNNEYDDFYGKDKSDYFDAKDFAATWQVGSDRACRKRQKGEKGGSSHESVCKAPEERQRATEACSALYSPAFFVCREKLDVTPYNQWVLINPLKLLFCMVGLHIEPDLTSGESRNWQTRGAAIFARIYTHHRAPYMLQGLKWRILEHISAQIWPFLSPAVVKNHIFNNIEMC